LGFTVLARAEELFTYPKSITKVDRDITFNEVADLSILREAQRELGIKSK